MDTFLQILIQHAKNLWNEEEGVTAIEYGLLAALIAVVIIVSVTEVGDNLILVFQRISTELATALGGGGGA